MVGQSGGIRVMRDHDHAGARIRQLAATAAQARCSRCRAPSRLVGEHHRRTHEQRARHRAARCCSPPDRALTVVFAPLAKTEPGQQLRDLHVVGLAMGERSGNITFSSTVRYGNEIVLLELRNRYARG